MNGGKQCHIRLKSALALADKLSALKWLALTMQHLLK
jgi:hypothetical protein